MDPIDVARLRATLGQPALERVVQALRRRLELGRTLGGSLTLQRVTPTERDACDTLLGRRPTQGDTLTLDLDSLIRQLAEAGICRDLADAVEVLTGPVTNRIQAAARHRATWESVWNDARQKAGFLRHPVLQDWLDELRDTGLVKRLCQDQPGRAFEALLQVSHLADSLPAPAEPLPALAARLFGDAHALDPGTPLATLAVRAAARIGGVQLDDHAEGRRAAWAGAGVMCDELSSPVLVFQLPTRLDSGSHRILQAAASAVEPVHLSLRLLLRHPLSEDPALQGRTIHACENPTLVALAVQHLGDRCAPLVCVSGQFATPALVLLRQLRQAGARVLYHGDFDPAGLAIAQRVFNEAGAEPWRFGVDDYRSAPKGIPFPGEPGPTPWSPDLSAALREDRRAVHEEAVFDVLALDLDLPA